MAKGLFVTLGVIAWVIAVAFGCVPTIRLRGPVVPSAGSNTSVLQDYEAVNAAGAATAGGFAVAGGLCFLAAGVATGAGRGGAIGV
jgi:hypothetical protein